MVINHFIFFKNNLTREQFYSLLLKQRMILKYNIFKGVYEGLIEIAIDLISVS